MSTQDTLAETRPISDLATVCIVGLGYVGLPLAVAFDEADFATIGYDIDMKRINAFEDGRDPTDEVGDKRIAGSDVTFTADPSAISQADYILITVPTPLDKIRNPELEFIESAARDVGRHISADSTVVLESTVYPGVTRDILAPIIADESGLAPFAEFNVGYSPERLSPGSHGRKLSEAVKIVGADTRETLAALSELYGTIVDAGIHEAPSIEIAEAAKVLENAQRDLNIALMNEMAIICDYLDLDSQEVINACATKWNFHEYTPGLVGGHCIPVDPLYLAHGSERAGFSPKLILQAREINEYMPKHVAEITLKALNDSGHVLRDVRLLVLGVSYKPNVRDTRTSKVRNVIRALDEYGVSCAVYDPIADTEEVSEELGIDRLEALQFEGFDGVILSTPHDAFHEYDFSEVAKRFASDPVFIDVHGTLDRDELVDAGYEYRRL